jgi:hypothetical protein
MVYRGVKRIFEVLGDFLEEEIISHGENVLRAGDLSF